MRNFVFFGRLVPEKGFDSLIPVFRKVLDDPSAIRFAVFGDGPLREELLRACSDHPGFHDCSSVSDGDCRQRFESLPSGSVAYFGRRDFSVIDPVLRACDASFVPSAFLETFGLSALESLSCGVPVAGFAKGGIVPFLLDDRLRLPDPATESPNSPASAERFEKAVLALADVPDETWERWKGLAKERASEYSEEAFRRSVRKFFPPEVRKILLVTDFVSNIGGIETYVRNLADTLRSMGYEVRTYGKSWGFSTRAEKIVSTLGAFANCAARSEIREELRSFRPDAVWCHSVLRRIGPVGLAPISDFPAFRVMTYHDLGYFSPFAAECRKESDVPPPRFLPFVRAAAPGFARACFAAAKYGKLRGIFRNLARFDLHLVPSDFLLPIVLSALPGADVRRLSHYVPETCPESP